MDKTFKYNSTIKDIQNSLLSQNIRDSSNIDLLTSEEAITNVIKSYIEKFNSVGNVLIDLNNFLVKSKDIINISYFNSLFEGIYIDLKALYYDLDSVRKVCKLNLQRNKNYYLILKKRIKDLWNKLDLTRLNVYDSNYSDKTYYESFSSDINFKKLNNITVDKKNGFVYLLPLTSKYQNKAYQIKSISCTTYPEPNNKGGIIKTSSNLNDLNYNYTFGTRDMLENGLWKEELYTKSVPEFSLNIGDSNNPFYRNYKGIVSIIDIEFSFFVEFNRLDFDIFGEKPLKIDSILYKKSNSDPWISIEQLNNDLLNGSIINSNNTILSDQKFDNISFINIEKVYTKYLRIVVNQENYSKITSEILNNLTLENTINNDLEERRYDIVKFNKNFNSFLSTPANDQNKSLYNKIISVIESTSNVEKILVEINKLLVPETNVITTNFSELIKYEIGLWSIEPTLEKYNNKTGYFESNNYVLNNKCLQSISLKTKQFINTFNTCNWYICIENKDIPIIENGSRYRKEPFYQVNLSEYSIYSNWNSGSFIQLDFPIDSNLVENIKFYINENEILNISNKIVYLNSSLLFLPNIKDINQSNYVVRYPASILNSISIYVLVQKPFTTTSKTNIIFGIASTKREILESFINDIRYKVLDLDQSYKYLKDDFIVVNSLCNINEAKLWFGENFNNCLYISEEIIDLLDSENFDRYSNRINITPSKMSSTISDINTYLTGIYGGTSDLNLISSINNITPIPSRKKL